ncbi:MAG: hypothetical protein CFE26_10585 [Verrucomicrobiales bacterium VVV1]|nr:MAG: hypothetical protein CFE26_10585 [Verrucomicrobiales bacterium VVV1]
MLLVRDAHTLNRVKSIRFQDTIRHLFFSPDSRWLLAIEDTSGEPDYINVVDTTTWQAVGRTPVRDLITSLAFMDEGKRFIASGRNGHIGVWDFDPSSGAVGVESQWGNYDGGVSGIILSPDEKTLIVASGTRGKALCEYEIANPKILWSQSTTAGVAAIAPFGPEGFITSDWDHHMRVWRKTPPATVKPPPPLVRVRADSFDPDSQFSLKYEIAAHSPPPNILDALIYLPKSNLLVTRGQDNIRVWSADDLTAIRSFGPRVQSFRDYRDRASNGAIAVTMDEKTVIASDDSGMIGFYDIGTGTLTRSFPNKVPGVDDAQTPDEGMLWQILPDREEKILYTTDRLSRLRAWDMETGKLLNGINLPAIGAEIKLSPNGRFLAVLTGAHGTARQLLVAADSLMILDSTAISDNSQNCAGSFSPDGAFFYRPQSDGQIIRYMVRKGKLDQQETLIRVPGHPLDICLSDDGSLAYLGTIADVIPLSVWDLENRRMLWQANRDQLPVWRLIPLPENRIACLCKDNKLRIFQKGTSKSDR